MKTLIRVTQDTKAYVVIESAIILPIYIFAIFGIIVVALYLPERAVLQRATQTAASSIAIQESDAWLRINENTGQLEFVPEKGNVYVNFVRSLVWTRNRRNTMETQAISIVENLSQNQLLLLGVGDIDVTIQTRNWVVYQEIKVTASRTMEIPVRFPFINMPLYIPMTYSSTAVVNNSAEFVRTIDMLVDLFRFITNSNVRNNMRNTVANESREG